MTSFIESYALWLADYYLLTTLLLTGALLAAAAVKQPAQKLAIAKSSLVALVLLAGLSTLPGWSLVHVRSVEPPVSELVHPPARQLTVDDKVVSTPVIRPTAMSTRQTAGAPLPSSISAAPKRDWSQIAWPGALAVAHLFGSGIVVTWLLAGLMAARRLRGRVTQPPGELAAMFGEIAHREDASGPQPELLVCDKIEVAVALGIWRPAVLLPMKWIEARSRDELRTVLAHEGAHLRNCDLHWLAASRALMVLLWAQPLYWLLRRRMRLDQEALADAAAAELSGRHHYAEQLVVWARNIPARPATRISPAVGLWEGSSQLRRRIAVLIDEHLVILRVCPRGWRRGALFLAVVCSLLLSVVTFRPDAPAVAQDATSTDPDRSADSADPAAPKFAKRPVTVAGKFGDGWEQLVVLPEGKFGVSDQIKLTVEEGWLCARRQSAGGELEWQIVLCRVDNDVLPEIELMDDMPFYFSLSYRQGRYFIRESMNLLRAMRESTPGGKLLAKNDLLGPDAKSQGWGAGRSPAWPEPIESSSWRYDDWFFVATGPDKDSWRAVVRLDPMEMPGGHGVSTTVAGHMRHFHGERWLIDDGELLLAERTTLPMYEAIKKERAAREAIHAGRLPAIDATVWLNTADAPTWDTLKGKVVLVDFWGTWCGPCVAKLPEIQNLQETYADRGLAVIGIHSQQNADTCAAFIKEQGYTFPIALDSGKTAEAFGISSWPAYFLFDRTGKVVQAFVSKPPTGAEVEALLSGLDRQSAPDASGENGGAAMPTARVRAVPVVQRTSAGQKRPSLLLSYGDGKADGKKSYGGSGHFIRFELPEGVTKVRGVRIHGSRYGYPQAPAEDFEITFLSENRDETLHTEAAPYRLFKRGKENWVRVLFDKEVELPQNFWIALNFNAEQTKGVYVSYDTSTKGEYSRVGLPGDEEEPKETDFGGDWMVQVMLPRPGR